MFMFMFMFMQAQFPHLQKGGIILDNQKYWWEFFLIDFENMEIICDTLVNTFQWFMVFYLIVSTAIIVRCGEP